MIQLNESEAAVYELLKLNQTPTKIANTIGKTTNYVFTILTFLVRQGMATKRGRKPSVILYKAVQVDYTIVKRPKGQLKNIKPQHKPHKIQILKKLIRLVGKDKLRFILNHHGKLPRRQIADKVGIRKVDLNQIYILLEKKGDDAA